METINEIRRKSIFKYEPYSCSSGSFFPSSGNVFFSEILHSD